MLVRVLLLGGSLVGFGAGLALFLEFGSASAGTGLFFVLPVVLAALAMGPACGLLAGVVASGFYTVGVELTTRPSLATLSVSVTVRLVLYVLIGMLVGGFAKRHRALAERLTADATHDFLTGLLNRRGFDVALARRLAAGQPFALLFADTDGLKRVNDLDGHAAGDAVLIRAGRLLAASLRTDDEIARLGGDEFAVLASLTGADTTEKLCHALEASLADRGVALSIGWALFPEDGVDADSVFQRADTRLYARKRRPNRPAFPARPNSVEPPLGVDLPGRALA